MATIKRFEDLDMWKLSRELCNKVGDIIDTGNFKNNYKIIGQIEGSSGSIMHVTEVYSISSKNGNNRKKKQFK